MFPSYLPRRGAHHGGISVRRWSRTLRETNLPYDAARTTAAKAGPARSGKAGIGCCAFAAFTLSAVAGAQSPVYKLAGPCSFEELSVLKQLPTEGLEKIVIEGPYEESSQGASFTYHYDLLELRAIDALIYGETGRSENRYRLFSSANYVVDHVDILYAESIYQQSTLVESKATVTYYVCDERLIENTASGSRPTPMQFEVSQHFLKELLERAPR